MNVTAINEVLEEFSPEEKEKIAQLILQSGINPRDPLIVTMATLAKIDNRIDRIPETLSSLINSWTEAIDTKLAQASCDAIGQQKKVILEAVKGMLQKKSVTSSAKNLLFLSNSIYPLYLFAVLGGVLALGTVIGAFVSANTIAKFVYPSSLNSQDKALLQWAKSEEGKQAKKIQKQNADAISFCKKQLKELKGKCVISVQD